MANLNGTGASGEFLRARAYDTMGVLGDTTTYNEVTQEGRKQMCCEYCHIGRAVTGWGPYNKIKLSNDGTVYSTHPVGRGDVVAGNPPNPNLVDDRKIRIIRDDDKGWESSIVIPGDLMQGIDLHLQDTTTGHLGGVVKSSDIGYETSGLDRGKKGVVICQTCHKPHSAVSSGQTHDGFPISGSKYMFDTSTQDLLLIDNNGKNGYNRLCEACHSYQPYLKISGPPHITQGHPLKHNGFPGGSYKFDEYGNPTANWDSTGMTAAACLDKDLPSGVSGISIPYIWPTGGNISGRNEIVCLTCHDVHGGVANTKLLRAIPLCIECHDAPPKRLGISHPVNVTLFNSDGSSWPDQANLTIFSPQIFNGKQIVLNSLRMYPQPQYNALYADPSNNYAALKYNALNVVKIGCDTCHDWTGGNIHYDVAKRRDVQKETRHLESWDNNRYFPNNKRYTTLDGSTSGHLHGAAEDPSHNSELCVSCHTRDNYNYDSLGISITGHADSTGANPSRYIKEYPPQFTGYKLGTPVTGNGNMELSSLDRLGTHASQLRISDQEGEGHSNRLLWVYWKYWGSPGESKVKALDPYYTTQDSDTTDPCAIMLSRKRSRWGQKFDTFRYSNLLSVSPSNMGLFANNTYRDKAAVICQSCHTPHYAAAGLVEYNTGVLASERTPHTALLYATQAESFLCRVCHVNGGYVAHPISKPSVILHATYANYRGAEDNTYINIMNIVADDSLVTTSGDVVIRRGIALGDKKHELVLTWEMETTRYFGEGVFGAIHLRNDTTFFNQSWKVSDSHGPLKPANYPHKGGSLKNLPPNNAGFPGEAVKADTSLLVCDSCHTPHAAGTSMGTYMVEGNDSSVPGITYASGQMGVSSSSGVASGARNFGAAQPTGTSDQPTCLLCHPQ
ncbi:cytochrome c3 family protein [Candidatus Desantisbacteria bacterium]|nr:cytochrome c3 family protein [Candidatus Desantisbacteria bacterium]